MFNARRILAALLAIGATLLSGRAFTQVQGPEGGSLPPVPFNPHFVETGCAACHEGGMAKPLPVQEQEQRCLSCHREERIRIELHPVKISAHADKVKQIPKGFPLLWGSLGCITCHDARIQCRTDDAAKHMNPKFLRGGPYMPSFQICYRCHNQQYYKVFNPHDQLDPAGKVSRTSCLFCHKRGENPGAGDLNVGPYMEGLCTGCHRGQFHGVGVDKMQMPGTEMEFHMQRMQKERRLYLPLSSDGKVHCATCHNPHEQGLFPADDIRSVGAEGEVSLHHRMRMRDGLICILCHSQFEQDEKRLRSRQ